MTLALDDRARAGFSLIRHGEVIKTFPTMDQCAAEAFERGWVIIRRGQKYLATGVSIAPLPTPPGDAP